MNADLSYIFFDDLQFEKLLQEIEKYVFVSQKRSACVSASLPLQVCCTPNNAHLASEESV